MKVKPPTGITWSLLELAGLLEDEDSHVHYGKIKKHLALHPFHLTNLNVALNEILRSSLNSYDSELQGFLLAYKNPKLLTTLGDTFYDSCFIHVDIEADFYVFRPEVGHVVKGIVNKNGYNHIGVVVHKAFNVSIPKTSDSGEWPNNLIQIGQEIKFTITHIDLTDRLPFIRGSINLENYSVGCKLLIQKTTKRKKTTVKESFYDRDNDSDNSCDSSIEKHETFSQNKDKYSKKKRHVDNGDIQNEENEKHSKKRLKLSQDLNHSEYKIENNVSYENSNDNTNNVNNSDIDTSTKKKKRSEKSSKKKSLEGSYVSETEFDCSTVRVKVEKDLTSNSDSENTTEKKLKKDEKSKRRSKEMKYSDNANCSIDNEEIQTNVKSEHKKHSKKRKLSSSDIDNSKVEIKIEGSPEYNDSTKYPLDKNNYENVSHRRKSSEKRIKKSLTYSEFGIDDIQIKEEKNTSESEHTQEDDRKDKISKIIKTENENYPNGLPTKRKRKREKTPIVEGEFESITIKEEKLDDSFDYTPQKNKSFRSKYIDNVSDNLTDEHDTEHIKKSPKKSKKVDIKSEPEEITIKEEKDKIKSEFKNEKNARESKSTEEKRHITSPKKHVKNELFKSSQSDYSTTEELEETKHNIFSPKKHSKNESFKNSKSDCSTTEEPEETKHNILSPKKRSKKSKEPKYEILPGNVKVKIERSSSVES